MLARVARFSQQPEIFTASDYRWVLDAIQEIEGFHAAYHLVDEATGDSISFTVFESETAVKSAEEAVSRARGQRGIETTPPDTVDVWRVIDRLHA